MSDTIIAVIASTAAITISTVVSPFISKGANLLCKKIKYWYDCNNYKNIFLNGLKEYLEKCKEESENTKKTETQISDWNLCLYLSTYSPTNKNVFYICPFDFNNFFKNEKDFIFNGLDNTWNLNVIFKQINLLHPESKNQII